MMSSEHPDEGTIHAWLDGALSDADAARLAAHVAGCAACAAAVAEARGMIAGATRIVRDLDEHASADAGPVWGAAPVVAEAPAAAARRDQSSAWRMLRVTPARSAIAAALLVAAGLTLTHKWTANDLAIASRNPMAIASDSTTTAAAPMTIAAAPAAPVAGAPAAERDPLLESAIARNIAQANPPRALNRTPGPGVPVTPPVASSAVTTDSMAPIRVAAARKAVRALRDTAQVAADKVDVGARSARAAQMQLSEVTVTAAGAMAKRTMSAAAAAPAPLAGTRCLRVESTTPGAEWGTIPLPFDVSLDASRDDGGRARVTETTVAGSRELAATWTRRSADSVQVELREPGVAGTLQLVVPGGRIGALVVAVHEIRCGQAGRAP